MRLRIDRDENRRLTAGRARLRVNMAGPYKRLRRGEARPARFIIVVLERQTGPSRHARVSSGVRTAVAPGGAAA